MLDCHAELGYVVFIINKSAILTLILPGLVPANEWDIDVGWGRLEFCACSSFLCLAGSNK